MRQAHIFYKDQLAGILTENDAGYEFRYLPEYLSLETAKAVSLTLPLQEAIYTSSVLFPFFDGLIPEGWLLDVALRNTDISILDRMSLLMTCCKDCIGAVSVVPVDEKTGPNEAQMEILKTIKRGYSNAGAIITSMTRFCNEHQLQAGHIHNALDSLEKSGYVKRKGQRLIAQLYFSLTEKGDAAACANMSETELKTIAVYGVDSQAIQFMHWIEKDDATMSEISGKHSIYMMELSAISEHLSDLGLVRVFGQGRLKAGLTDAGRQLLRKTAAQHS